MNTSEPLDRLEIKPPRLRFWHILLAGFGFMLLAVLALGTWHWWRISRQTELVAQVEAAGGNVSYYHEFIRRPDGGFQDGEPPSLFPNMLREKYPNLCSQVFGVTMWHFPEFEEPDVAKRETEDFFRAAKDFPRLKSFDIHCDYFDGGRIGELASLRELQVLRLAGDQITDSTIQDLIQAKDLRHLSLDPTRLTDAAVPPLSELSKLRGLTLGSPLITDAGVAKLKLPENLKHLHLDLPVITDAGIAQLKLPGNLEYLRLNLPAVTDAGICSLPKLSRLSMLRLEMEIGDAGIAHLSSGGQLTSLAVSQARFGDAGLAAIAKNQSLGGALSFDGSAITDEGLRHFVAMPDVYYLQLSGSKVTDAGVKRLAPITNLKCLLLARTQVTGVGLVQLHGLPKLYEIDLSDCPVTEEGLSALHGLQALAEIKLAGTPIIDQYCARIPAARPRVVDHGRDSILDLSRTKLTDECVKLLLPTTFHTVRLDQTALTDAGLLAIAADEGELAELSVRGTQITAKGVLDFFDRLEARGRTCQLEHDVPHEEISALESRLGSDPAAAAFPGGASPE